MYSEYRIRRKAQKSLHLHYTVVCNSYKKNVCSYRFSEYERIVEQLLERRGFGSIVEGVRGAQRLMRRVVYHR